MVADLRSDLAEILLIFDGTSPTQHVRRMLSRLPATVHVLPKQRSLGAVLNVGLDRASGDWVSRIDADDLWVRGRLDAQLSLMHTSPQLVLAGSNALTVDDSGAVIGRLSAGSGMALKHRLLVRNQFIHPSVVMRADAVRQAGGYPDIVRLEDYGLWLALARIGDVTNVDACWVRYRVHAAQASAAAVGAVAVAEIRRRRLMLAEQLRVPAPLTDGAHYLWVVTQKFTNRGHRLPTGRFKFGPVA